MAGMPRIAVEFWLLVTNLASQPTSQRRASLTDRQTLAGCQVSLKSSPLVTVSVCCLLFPFCRFWSTLVILRRSAEI